MNDRPALLAHHVVDVDGASVGQGELAAVRRKRQAEHAAKPTDDRLAQHGSRGGVSKPGVTGGRVTVEDPTADGERAAVGGVSHAEDIERRSSAPSQTLPAARHFQETVTTASPGAVLALPLGSPRAAAGVRPSGENACALEHARSGCRR